MKLSYQRGEHERVQFDSDPTEIVVQASLLVYQQDTWLTWWDVFQIRKRLQKVARRRRIKKDAPPDRR